MMILQSVGDTPSEGQTTMKLLSLFSTHFTCRVWSTHFTFSRICRSAPTSSGTRWRKGQLTHIGGMKAEFWRHKPQEKFNYILVDKHLSPQKRVWFSIAGSYSTFFYFLLCYFKKQESKKDNNHTRFFNLQFFHVTLNFLWFTVPG